MRIQDTTKISLTAIISQPMRSFLTALGIAVGIASVVLLTSLGEGVQKYVLSEFTQFGTNLIAVTPGKATTSGPPGAMINNVRPLSLDDALALSKIPKIIGMVPVIQGNAAVEYGKRTRRTAIYGVGSDVPNVWRMDVASGRFLPEDDPRRARAFAVIANKVRQSLFGNENPLGRAIRIGGERYRVIGLMETKGQMLGFDLDDAVYIPAARAMAMFNRESLMEIDLLYQPGSSTDLLKKRIRNFLMERHGSEDFTITTQEQMLEVLGSILDILTLAISALGGISLVVGGVGILTILTIAVNERKSEIGLLRAIGAGKSQILMLFLGEAVVLAGIGGLAGLVIGAGGAWLLSTFVPALPTHTPWSYVVLAELLAISVGLIAGVLPAQHAANLDPIEALRAE